MTHGGGPAAMMDVSGWRGALLALPSGYRRALRGKGMRGSYGGAHRRWGNGIGGEEAKQKWTKTVATMWDSGALRSIAEAVEDDAPVKPGSVRARMAGVSPKKTTAVAKADKNLTRAPIAGV
ncbi:hypothetical protein E2562_031034 [Oryza meyeriana var. granulata]|uniref:Uncharacterized protein n=1 Tax=Oryza meyeriana var. granulata TaxID=110450 RepID=A0A6G1FE79_9ORYZ|nr:hypothetical protein E2562_031034 [Oryza meyeriana var. granulata]